MLASIFVHNVNGRIFFCLFLKQKVKNNCKEYINKKREEQKKRIESL